VYNGRISRWAVDLNRSPSNPAIWSTAARRLPIELRRELIEDFHRPHWHAIETAVSALLVTQGQAVHVAVHSFTPVLAGAVRTMDLGLLYDPSRPLERSLTAAWVRELGRVAPQLVVRRNAPYRGVNDGLTRHLRRHTDDPGYAGIELELNQTWVDGGRVRRPMVEALLRSLWQAVDGAETAHRRRRPWAPTADRSP
jgi:predicted N-formylglutamate amidohydrolase